MAYVPWSRQWLSLFVSSYGPHAWTLGLYKVLPMLLQVSQCSAKHLLTPTLDFQPEILYSSLSDWRPPELHSYTDYIWLWPHLFFSSRKVKSVLSSSSFSCSSKCVIVKASPWISTGITASVPKAKLNDVSPVVDLGVVR